MSVYRRGDVWWYKFRFAGQVIRESSKSESKTFAKEVLPAQRTRRILQPHFETTHGPTLFGSR
jgi:hypothetical protein